MNIETMNNNGTVNEYNGPVDNSTKTYGNNYGNHTEAGDIHQTINNKKSYNKKNNKNYKNNKKNDKYDEPVIDDEEELSFDDLMKQPFEIKIEEEVRNIFAIAYSGNKAAFATNINNITNNIFEGSSANEASLKVLYNMLRYIKGTSKHRKQMNTIMLWGNLNDLADNKNTFYAKELKAIANEILKMKQELKDCVIFKKVNKGDKVYGNEYTVKDAAWKLLGY
jgi:hypothetical protein